MFHRLAILLALLLAALSPARAQERILSFISDVTVERNGDLVVIETITVDAQGNDIKRGILRDFPTIYTSTSGRRVVVGFTVRSVTRDGRAEIYTTENLSNGVRIRIGRADTLLTNGPHIYVISYRTTRQIGFYDQFDELYWNATGTGWTFPIDMVEARIRLPAQVPFVQKALYTGPQGAHSQDANVVTEEPGLIIFRTTKPLPAHNGLTIAAGWQKGVVDPPPGPGFIERTTDRIAAAIASTWVFQHLPLTLALLGLPLVLAYYAYAWRKAAAGRGAGP